MAAKKIGVLRSTGHPIEFDATIGRRRVTIAASIAEPYPRPTVAVERIFIIAANGKATRMPPTEEAKFKHRFRVAIHERVLDELQAQAERHAESADW